MKFMWAEVFLSGRYRVLGLGRVQDLGFRLDCPAYLRL